eukprot:TRINITY_DN26172_c0_g1_i1.p1 TRINITY_DN26172_c0_g1~~TRINITY_DN26172_c0_g1_i1.p1  ORF type:complete len:220 (-),score=29.89 TRINITY_DN26172_c0_g1_i1:440-1099(-)
MRSKVEDIPISFLIGNPSIKSYLESFKPVEWNSVIKCTVLYGIYSLRRDGFGGTGDKSLFSLQRLENAIKQNCAAETSRGNKATNKIEDSRHQKSSRPVAETSSPAKVNARQTRPSEIRESRESTRSKKYADYPTWWPDDTESETENRNYLNDVRIPERRPSIDNITPPLYSPQREFEEANEDDFGLRVKKLSKADLEDKPAAAKAQTKPKKETKPEKS